MLKKYQFKFQPFASLFFFLMFFLFLSLSFWQFNRAQEKKLLLSQYEISLKKAALDLSQIKNFQALMSFQLVKIRGTYDTQHQFLLDNKTRNKQIGYEVLTPFYSGKHTLMINRGWIPRTGSRQQLPSLAPISGEQEIVGTVTFPSSKSFILGNIEENPNQWPRVIQALDLSVMSRALGKPVEPFIIQLAPEASHGFVRDWPVTVTTPEKHIGYAIQWGLLALVQLIVLIRFNFQKVSAE